jgi:hypothetical protein
VSCCRVHLATRVITVVQLWLLGQSGGASEFVIRCDLCTLASTEPKTHHWHQTPHSTCGQLSCYYSTMCVFPWARRRGAHNNSRNARQTESTGNSTRRQPGELIGCCTNVLHPAAVCSIQWAHTHTYTHTHCKATNGSLSVLTLNVPSKPGVMLCLDAATCAGARAGCAPLPAEAWPHGRP